MLRSICGSRPPASVACMFPSPPGTTAGKHAAFQSGAGDLPACFQGYESTEVREEPLRTGRGAFSNVQRSTLRQYFDKFELCPNSVGNYRSRESQRLEGL